jgi:hypothetical protein
MDLFVNAGITAPQVDFGSGANGVVYVTASRLTAPRRDGADIGIVTRAGQAWMEAAPTSE